MLEEEKFASLRNLISSHTGMDVEDSGDDKLRQAVAERLNVLGLPPARYLALLEARGGETEREWDALVSLMTVGESYFFRDKGQIEVLRRWLLPELIERARFTRTLRLWSTGCSRGEEAYTLAILLRELIPDIDDWNIEIWGTDINRQALRQGGKGIFDAWSLRALDSVKVAQYFTEQVVGAQRCWLLTAPIRKLVTFRYFNLFKDCLLGPFSGFDLILCRNVFIYFRRDAISAVADKLANALAPGGYLMTGHAELHEICPNGVIPRLFPETIAYQRVRSPSADHPMPIMTPLPPRTPLKIPARPRLSSNQTGEQLTGMRPPKPLPSRDDAELMVIKELHKNHEYGLALERAERFVARRPEDFRGNYLLSWLYADVGRYEQALVCAEQALNIDPFAAAPYFLLAHLAEERGDVEEAKRLLKKALYLDPAYTSAYLELAALYALEGDEVRTRKARIAALDLLKNIPGQTAVEPYCGLTASQLTSYVREMLEHG
ncbi:MAG: hypothetical protein NUV50_10705 [Rhodospirillales bacterium]|nr:hypothetical protein [Rhodospirillales bacterium]